MGIDPSTQAIAEGRIALGEATSLVVGVASDLPYVKGQFDVVIIGFCLCLCDPQDWQSVVAETNRVLMNRGILLIHDYHRPTNDLGVGVWPYQHTPPVPWYFFNWKNLWLSHPGYKPLAEKIREGTLEKVVVLQKYMPDVNISPG
jgi:ubiquinone/menaquinone biosynthesis C-methylase UbiE